MTTPGSSFTVSYKGRSRVLQSDIDIDAVKGTGNPSRPLTVKAIWDTGATSTVIRPEVAVKLGLKTISIIKIATPSGTKDCNQYFVNVYLPNHIKVERVLVAEAVPANCDVLIGMDIIGTGDFAVSNFDDKTAFSFRMPSMQKIDFVNHSYLLPHEKKDTPGRNEPCPCGSGKKYKNCCGKN
jgi:predicted aspartyl protease